MRNTSAVAILILCSTAHGYFFRGKAGKTKKLENENESRDSAIAQEQGGSSSAFGTSLFSELCADFPDTNVLFSPLSVYQAIALVKDGATIRSENDLELEDILGPQTVRDRSNLLQKQSEGNETFSGVKLSMATSIWADNLRQSYIDRAMETQSAEALPLPDTYADIDDWIENKTDGMITEAMGDKDLDPLTVALLVNAVHFKGVWTYAFNPNDTADDTFTLSDGTQVEAMSMIAQRDMEVIGSSPSLGGATVAVLDYGGNATGSAEFTSMFILPAFPGIDSMKDVISGLDSRPISQLLDEAYMAKVRLKLPRFRMEFGPTKLKPSLERMGMTIAFNESVPWKFNRMSNGDPWLYVDDIHHGSCIEVSEEGTEASAATVVVVKTKSVQRTLEIIFNRPFVVIVLHRLTGIPIFIGKVENPVFIF